MAQAILQDRRAIRAEGIIARQECELQDNGTWRVRDSATGSGKWHNVFNGHCSCYDYLQRGSFCKHLRAVQQEEEALAQYCADWNARSEQAKNNNLLDLPGDLLDTDLNFDDGVVTICDKSPRCPMCGSLLITQVYYIGGRGYTSFEVCSGDGSHPARKLS